MTDQSAPEKRKRGRPAKEQNDRKNTYLGFRVRDGMREKLQAAADAGSRSPSEEIERRLIRSFEMEEQIKATQEREDMMWPDAEARALGRAFAMTLAAARHAGGRDWREDPAVPLVVAGAVRRLLDRCIRDGGTLAAGLAVDSVRAAATADGIAQMVGPALDEAMPPLPTPALDVMQWTGRVFLQTEFRDAATGEVLETVTGPEVDVADPEQRSTLGDGYMPALARFAPIRDKVDVETFTSYVMKDGTVARVSLDFTSASPGPQAPAKPTPDGTRWATPDEIAGMVPVDDPKRPDSLFARADFDEVAAGMPADQGERPQPAPEPAPAPKRGRPRKVPVGA